MKTLRLILLWVGIAGILLALLVLTAISPPLQTWAALRALNGSPGIQASIDSLSAGFGRIDVEKARIEAQGVVLNVPLLQAQVPLTRAVFGRKVSIESLVARGWTLDLSHERHLAAGKVSPAEAALLLLGCLDSLGLPLDASANGVDLEGDVLLPGPAADVPSKVHLSVTGGGLASGRDGEFAFEASAEGTGSPVSSGFAKGKLWVTMRTPRTFDALRVSSDVTLTGDAAQRSLSALVEASASRGPGGESYALALSRGGRRIASLEAAPSPAGGLEGKWSASLSESDMAPFAPFTTLPPIGATGAGSFSAEPGLSRVRATGALHASVGGLEFIHPSLAPLGKGSVDTEFEGALSGHTLHVERLKFSFSGTRAKVSVACLQPFDFNADSHALSVASPDKDFLAGSVEALPLDCTPSPSARLRVSGGELAGRFIVRPHDGGFALRLQGPLLVSGLRLSGSARPLAGPVDLAVPLSGEMTPKGWTLESGSSSVGAAGRDLASFAVKASRVAGLDQPVSVSGSWTTAADPSGGSCSGDFTAKVTDTASIDCRLSWGVPGSAAADVHADADLDGDVSFTAPVHFGSGTASRVLASEGSFSVGTASPELDLKLSSDDLTLSELLLFAGPVASVAGGSLEPLGGPATEGVPFWGSWTGGASFSFKRLRIADGAYDDVAGELRLSAGQARIESGRTWVLGHNLAKFEGAVSFEPKGQPAYVLRGSGSVDSVDAPAFFGPAAPGRGSLVEGHFAVAGTLSSGGSGLADLSRAAREQLVVTGTSGILRVLRTDVSDSVPTPATPVTDALGTVGSAVGSVLGIHKGIDRVDRNPVSPATDAIINFTYETAELGFDRFTATVEGGPDGALHLSKIEIDCPDEHIRGTGDIAAALALVFSKRPLSLDLVLSFKGHPAELLSKAGLLAPKKDDDGFKPLSERVRLIGTLEQIDPSPWHDFLARAVREATSPPKKTGP